MKVIGQSPKAEYQLANASINSVSASNRQADKTYHGSY